MDRLTPTYASSEAIEEEAFPAEPATVSDTSVGLWVESVEEGACDQVGGPDYHVINNK